MLPGNLCFVTHISIVVLPGNQCFVAYISFVVLPGYHCCVANIVLLRCQRTCGALTCADIILVSSDLVIFGKSGVMCST